MHGTQGPRPAAAILSTIALLAAGCGGSRAAEVRTSYAAIWGEGGGDAIAALYADDTAGGVRALVEELRGRYPDLKLTVDHALGEGDLVSLAWTATGTPEGAKGPVTLLGVTLARFQDGRIVEDWTRWDTLEERRELGYTVLDPGAADALRKEAAEAKKALDAAQAKAGAPPRVFVGASQVDLTPTDAEKAQPTSRRPLHESKAHTAVWLRTTESETPHTHPGHDLAVVNVKGASKLHVGDDVFDLAPHDVVFVPKATPHWLEVTGDAPAEAVVVATPKIKKPKKFRKPLKK